MSLIEAVAGTGLVAGLLLLTGIAEEKRVAGTLLTGQRDETSGARQVRFFSQSRRPFQCGDELLLFSTVEVTPVLEWSPSLHRLKRPHFLFLHRVGTTFDHFCLVESAALAYARGMLNTILSISGG